MYKTQRSISSNKRLRPQNDEIGFSRKQSRSNQDDTSVRSQSQDIALDLENCENDRRIFNFNNHNTNGTHNKDIDNLS